MACCSSGTVTAALGRRSQHSGLGPQPGRRRFLNRTSSPHAARPKPDQQQHRARSPFGLPVNVQRPQPAQNPSEAKTRGSGHRPPNRPQHATHSTSRIPAVIQDAPSGYHGLTWNGGPEPPAPDWRIPIPSYTAVSRNLHPAVANGVAQDIDRAQPSREGSTLQATPASKGPVWKDMRTTREQALKDGGSGTLRQKAMIRDFESRMAQPNANDQSSQHQSDPVVTSHPSVRSSNKAADRTAAYFSPGRIRQDPSAAQPSSAPGAPTKAAPLPRAHSSNPTPTHPQQQSTATSAAAKHADDASSQARMQASTPSPVDSIMGPVQGLEESQPVAVEDAFRASPLPSALHPAPVNMAEHMPWEVDVHTSLKPSLMPYELSQERARAARQSPIPGMLTSSEDRAAAAVISKEPLTPLAESPMLMPEAAAPELVASNAIRPPVLSQGDSLTEQKPRSEGISAVDPASVAEPATPSETSISASAANSQPESEHGLASEQQSLASASSESAADLVTRTSLTSSMPQPPSASSSAGSVLGTASPGTGFAAGLDSPMGMSQAERASMSGVSGPISAPPPGQPRGLGELGQAGQSTLAADSLSLAQV